MRQVKKLLTKISKTYICRAAHHAKVSITLFWYNSIWNISGFGDMSPRQGYFKTALFKTVCAQFNFCAGGFL